MKNIAITFKKITKYTFENKWLSLMVSFLAGFLAVIPYYYEKLFVFTFMALFLLFAVINVQRTVSKRTFLPFFFYYLGFYSPLYLFLSELYPFERFGFTKGQGIFIVICSCLFIPIIHALVSALIMLISKAFKKDSLLPIGYAALMVIIEWVLSLGTLAFPWGNTAVSLTGFLPYLQTASLFGKSFITLITVFACAAFATAVTNNKRFLALIGALVITVNSVLGTFLWFIPAEKGEAVNVAVIQGNALADQKFLAENRSEIFNRHIALTEEAAINGAKIIVLAESAIPFSFTEDGQIHNAFAEITTKYNVTIICGVSYYEGSDQYNSCIAIMPDGSLAERYDKRHLVPFGEFIPFAELIGKFVPFVKALNEETGTFIEGNRVTVFQTEYGNISPLICFDSIFPQFARDNSVSGAEMFAIVTNDSWFNDSVGIYTHLRHAQVRAIENRRYVLRAANTGISALIDEQGKIIDQAEALTVDIKYGEVSPIESETVFTKFGDLSLYCSFVIIILLLICSLRSFKNGEDQAS